MKILFVCLGNICRSPLAEIAFADLVAREGLGDLVEVDSAGTAGYHEGELADPRSRSVAQAHGLEIVHRSRQIRASDFQEFDYLIAMDDANRRDLLKRAATDSQKRKIRLLRDWDPAGPGEVADPYYGTTQDFETVFEICERSSRRLLEDVKLHLKVER